MIFKSQSPLSPDISLIINGVATDYSSIVELELDLRVSQHDYLKIVIRGIPGELLMDYLNTGVTAEWSQGANSHRFCGYVVSIDPNYHNSAGTVNGSPFQAVVLHCFGASYDMRGKRNRVWENTNIESIAKKFSKEYRYSLSVPLHTQLIPRIVQTNESDWEFLVKMAYFFGLHVSVHGTHMHLWSSSGAMGRGISFHELKNIRAKGNDPVPEPGVILTMRGSLGETPYKWNTHDKRLTILDDYGTTYTATYSTDTSPYGRPFRFDVRDDLSYSAPTTDVADLVLSGVSGQLTTFDIDIEATGTSGIKPGGIVFISDFQSKIDGYWYVHDVCHSIRRTEFFTKLRLCRNTTNDDPAFLIPSSPIPVIPDPVYINGVWQSINDLEDIYV